MEQNHVPPSSDADVALALAPHGQSILLRSIFWAELRRQSGALRFCRNYPTGQLVHDFYCLNARLAIAVEGEDTAAISDPMRCQWLERANIEQLVVTEAELHRDPRGAALRAVMRARQRLPHAHPAFSA